MMPLLARLLGRAEPTLAAAGARDAAAFAPLHAASFSRGWSEHEFELFLADRSVIADRLAVGNRSIGFILSRIAAGEAEILSVAIARSWRGRGHARGLLDRHLRRLAGAGVRTVFLEVDEDNAPARRLYARAGFREAGRRTGYYPRAAGQSANALVLRRDLV